MLSLVQKTTVSPALVVVGKRGTTRLERFTLFMSQAVAFLYTDRAIYFDYRVV